jgi:hypothetical protein
MFSWPPPNQPNEQWVGVFLQWLPSYGWHTGIIFRGNTSSVYAIHLLGHRYLGKGRPPEGCWIIQIDVPRIRISSITGLLRMVMKKYRFGGPSYGFSSPEREWFTAFGTVVPHKPGEGLTCTSMVIALFKSAGFPLIDLETWPSRNSDQQRKINWVLRNQERRPEMREEERLQFDAIAALKAENRCLMLEMLGAAYDHEHPTAFVRAKSLGQSLRPQICIHFARVMSEA